MPAHDVDLWYMTGGPPPYLGTLVPTGASLRESFPVLLGAGFCNQAVVLDPTTNAFGGVLSAAATAIVGG